MVVLILFHCSKKHCASIIGKGNVPHIGDLNSVLQNRMFCLGCDPHCALQLIFIAVIKQKCGDEIQCVALK